MTDLEEVRAKRYVNLNDDGEAVAVTRVVKNNRGQLARISTEFQGDFPAESESIAGEYAWKKGEILIQHQMHDGRGKCRLAMSGVVDVNGGLAWVIDSTTTSPSGSPGQDEAAPIVLNVGEANGTYLVYYADGRIKYRRGTEEYTTTVAQQIEMLARQE